MNCRKVTDYFNLRKVPFCYAIQKKNIFYFENFKTGNIKEFPVS